MASEQWQHVSLGDLIDIKHGYAFEGQYFRDDPPGDILLTPGNFAIGGGFQAGKVKYYDGPVPEEFVLQAGDLLVTMTDLSKNGDTLGYPAFVPPLTNSRYLHNQRLGRVLVRPGALLDDRFLYYLLRTSRYRTEILAGATGTTVKHTSPTRIKGFTFPLPPLAEQRAIARILGALDDKIELNRRMNETLEATARALFQSWFVDFDPVRAKAEGRPPAGMDAATAALFPDGFEQSPLGLIPRGWRVGEMGDIAMNSRTGVMPDTLPPDTPYIGLEHMPSKSIALPTWGTVADVSSNKSAFRQGEILFGKLRPYFHKVGVAPVDGVCSTDVLVIAPKSPEWFGMTLLAISSSEIIDYATSHSDGTRMPRTSWHDLTKYRIVVPGQDIAQGFTRWIEPLIQSMQCAIVQSRTLAATRDALLPKLLSGEVRVAEAERVVEEVKP